MAMKPELVAIYRLEFYRKQQNWKLSSSRDNKKSSEKPPEKESKLNATYDVENSEDRRNKKEESEPHNIAFIESDSDKKVPSISNQSSNQKHRLSLEQQEPVNIWPDISIEKNQELNKSFKSHEKPRENWTQNRLKQLQMAANLSETELVDDNGNLAEEYYDGATECRSWSEQGLEWKYDCDDQMKEEDLLDYDMTNDIWSYGKGSDVVESPSHSTFTEYQQPRLLDNVLWTTDMDECVSTSVDSAGEFIRGADAAPHSSELDLSLPPCMAPSDVSFATLSQLSTPQLVRAARLHTRALRRLLLESEQRQKLRNIVSLVHSDLSFEDHLSMDIDPCVDRQTRMFTDKIIAGSHRQMTLGGGRGRGRLPNWETNTFI